MADHDPATRDDPMRYLREPIHRYRITLSSYPGKERWIRTFEAATALGAPKAVQLAVTANSYRDPENVVFDVIVDDLGAVVSSAVLGDDLIDDLEFR